VIFMGSENLNNGSSTAADRNGFSAGPYRQGRRDGVLPGEPVDPDLAPRNGSASVLDPGAGLERPPSLPSLDLGGLAEPVFPPPGWMENGTPVPSMADHPLLRGLLLELPPRGATPPPGWLDRWFEAARSILELLYVQDAQRRP
jgi:hypothetical protein